MIGFVMQMEEDLKGRTSSTKEVDNIKVFLMQSRKSDFDINTFMIPATLG